MFDLRCKIQPIYKNAQAGSHQDLIMHLTAITNLVLFKIHQWAYWFIDLVIQLYTNNLSSKLRFISTDKKFSKIINTKDVKISKWSKKCGLMILLSVIPIHIFNFPGIEYDTHAFNVDLLPSTNRSENTWPLFNNIGSHFFTSEFRKIQCFYLNCLP